MTVRRITAHTSASTSETWPQAQAWSSRSRTARQPPPPPPQAPPLPFRVLGRYTDQKGGYVLLTNDQRGIAVRIGDVIDGVYEVRAIEGSSMTLIYLPLRQVQMLDIGMPLSLMN